MQNKHCECLDHVGKFVNPCIINGSKKVSGDPTVAGIGGYTVLTILSSCTLSLACDHSVFPVEVVQDLNRDTGTVLVRAVFYTSVNKEQQGESKRS